MNIRTCHRRCYIIYSLLKIIKVYSKRNDLLIHTQRHTIYPTQPNRLIHSSYSPSAIHIYPLFLTPIPHPYFPIPYPPILYSHSSTPPIFHPPHSSPPPPPPLSRHPFDLHNDQIKSNQTNPLSPPKNNHHHHPITSSISTIIPISLNQETNKQTKKERTNQH